MKSNEGDRYEDKKYDVYTMRDVVHGVYDKGNRCKNRYIYRFGKNTGCNLSNKSQLLS